jgi:hypothetical protein
VYEGESSIIGKMDREADVYEMVRCLNIPEGEGRVD